MIRLEHLPADVFGLPDMARAALSGRSIIEGLPIARQVSEISAPEDRYLPDERAHLSKWLEARVAAYSPHVAVLDSVRSLAAPGASCVVTSQRPGLFASPLVGLWKALQTVRLSWKLAALWEAPVVPVLWNQADDHDVASVHHSYLLNRNFDVQKVNLSGLSSGRVPFSRVRLSDERHGLSALASLLRQMHGDHESVEEAVELFAPRDGETLAGAFSRTLYALLGHTGLLVIEPDWLRGEVSHALADVVGAPIVEPLHAAVASLTARGFELPIAVEHAGLLFHLDAGGRRALRSGGDGYCYDDEPGSRTPAELAAEIVQEPAAWSPGALLAPLTVDRVLPVACAVGGFDALALRAILAPLRNTLGLENPPFVLRSSVSLVDEGCRRSARRLGIPLADVLATRGQIGAGTQLHPDPGLARGLREIGRQAKRDLLEQVSELAAVDRTLGVLGRRTADQVDRSVRKLVEKVSRVQANQAGKGRRHQRRLNHSLCPRGEAQERVFGAFPFVARYGRNWIDELLAEIDPLAGEHVLVHLGPDESAAAAAGE